MSDQTHAAPDGGIDYIAVEQSPRFLALKRKQRSFIFPLAAFFLIWYFVYVLLAAFATDFMGQRVWGDITVGLLFGLGQFVTTFAITMAYVSFANRKLDPLSAEIREDLEKAQAQA
ncbi:MULTISPECIES: DUF485 domain-containing protein [Microbacterium]|jgi:uncharacterized membrane protein (DUF485 family)|uniref:DUF485 domain-containing protein n=1 Tax=Microbacterium algeriense TaxID=2615184 RepID=A0ABQ6VEB7_9MICO|nr:MULTISPECIES: DUF485 domain-containing protein [Microbacterium]AZH79404.1 DUF485 domain-containing protein [Microbacterium sp. Y-01]KAB1867394.1 DUF485 domain-containing protein [Microbacterium algeriense]MDX2399591.1 DUF485 domain-containing protein [Microbacterium algeriense]